MVPLQNVAEWCRKFSAGKENVDGYNRNEQQSTVTAEVNIAHIQEKI
jgi:hypothetical protein